MIRLALSFGLYILGDFRYLLRILTILGNYYLKKLTFVIVYICQNIILL